MATWLDHAGSFPIERRELPDPGGFQPMLPAPKGCLHTTEGTDVDQAWGYHKAKGWASHFYVGEGRIIQARNLQHVGTTLRGGFDVNKHFIQIEAVFRVADIGLKTHLMKPSTLEPLLALMETLRDTVGIPLKRPTEWPDQLPGGVWAVEGNPRRQDGYAFTRPGWYGHIDVPGNTHWDPGSFLWREAFAKIEEDDVALNDAQLKVIRDARQTMRGVDDFLADKEPPADADPARRQMYRALVRAASRPTPSDVNAVVECGDFCSCRAHSHEANVTLA